MNTRGLQKHYDKLTDLERFRLAMAAFERNDEAEMRALRDTAPKGTYRTTKWEYKQMFTALEWVTLYVTQSVLFYGFLSSLGWGLEYAKPYTEDTERPPNADVMMAEKVLAKWDALALFCDELGVTREQALGLCIPPGVLEQVVDFADKKPSKILMFGQCGARVVKISSL